MSNAFTLPLKVYYEDTDCMGVVYHANYLRFFERTRYDWFNQLKFDVPSWLAAGNKFLVKKIEIEYMAPARLGDHLVGLVKIHQLGRASITLMQEVLRDGAILCKGLVVLVCVDAEHRVSGISGALREELSEHVPV